MSPFEAYQEAFIEYLNALLTSKNWEKTRELRAKMQAVKNTLTDYEFMRAGYWEQLYVNKKAGRN